MKDKGRRDYTLNPRTRGPTNGVQFTQHLESILETSPLQLQPRPVALFALGGTKIPALHELTQDPQFHPIEEQAGSSREAVKIDPQVYFPLRFEDTVIEINKAVAAGRGPSSIAMSELG